MMNETVQSIMIRKVFTLSPDDTLAVAKDFFLNRRIHHLPVVDEGRLIGLITTYDLWKKDIKMSEYDKVKVKDVMSTAILKLSPEDKIGTAAELFLDNRFHALPIVRDGMLVGLVTSFDVLKYEFKKEYPQPILFKEVFEDEYAAAS